MRKFQIQILQRGHATDFPSERLTKLWRFQSVSNKDYFRAKWCSLARIFFARTSSRRLIEQELRKCSKNFHTPRLERASNDYRFALGYLIYILHICERFMYYVYVDNLNHPLLKIHRLFALNNHGDNQLTLVCRQIV